MIIYYKLHVCHRLFQFNFFVLNRDCWYIVLSNKFVVFSYLMTVYLNPMVIRCGFSEYIFLWYFLWFLFCFWGSIWIILWWILCNLIGDFITNKITSFFRCFFNYPFSCSFKYICSFWLYISLEFLLNFLPILFCTKIKIHILSQIIDL